MVFFQVFSCIAYAHALVFVHQAVFSFLFPTGKQTGVKFNNDRCVKMKHPVFQDAVMIREFYTTGINIFTLLQEPDKKERKSLLSAKNKFRLPMNYTDSVQWYLLKLLQNCEDNCVFFQLLLQLCELTDGHFKVILHLNKGDTR